MDECVVCGTLFWDGSEYLSLRLCLGGGPQVRLDLNVVPAFLGEFARISVYRIAWPCARDARKPRCSCSRKYD